MATGDYIQAGRSPTASSWIPVPRGPEKAGQAAGLRLWSQACCPHHTFDRCGRFQFLEKAVQGLCCYTTELKGKDMGKADQIGLSYRAAREGQAETTAVVWTPAPARASAKGKNIYAIHLAGNPVSLKITVHLRTGLNFKTQPSFWSELCMD